MQALKVPRLPSLRRLPLPSRRKWLKPHHGYSAIAKYLIGVATAAACSRPVRQVMVEGMCEVTGDTVTVSELTKEVSLGTRM